MKLNNNPTQCERVLRYLEDFGEIDSLQAIRDLGIMRLASRISEMRSRGIKIGDRVAKGKNRYGEPVFWKVYFLLERQKENG